jgi:GntR family transcriptional regulator/MocR family aminotransferase
VDLHLSFKGQRHLTGEVYRRLREAILEGRLRPHEALPSSRELARRLEVSRTTVLSAYERLRSEGFLSSKAGAGTFVTEGIRPRSPAGPADSPLRPRAVWNGVPEGLDMSATRAEFDFRPGIPDASRFPFAAWRARVSRQLHAKEVGQGSHIGAAGHPGFRAAIARHISVSRAVRCTADDVLVTNGSQQAIDLIARVLLEPGDKVAVEDPGYPLPRGALHAYGCRVAGVPVDEEGLVVDAIPRGVRLIYVTPSHQYPLGMAMSMGRRQALLAWANRVNAAIVEDDYDSEFRYGPRPLEPLQTLDESGCVLYIGSFSKVLLPTLRLGFVVAPRPLHAALRKAKHLADWHTAVPMQAAAAQFIEDGLLAQHIRRMRRIYSERHERIVRVLERDFRGCLTPLPSTGGLHLSALLDERYGASDQEIVERAATQGVAVFPLAYHYVATPPRRGLMFGYGAISSDRIEPGLRRLRGCVEPSARQTGMNKSP